MQRKPTDLRRFAVLLLALLFARIAAAQQFAQPTVIATGNWPAAIYTADINGDGFPDLIYIDHGATPASSSTHVLLNDGSGHFTESARIATAGSSVAIGTFLGSGHPDIAWLTTAPTGFGIHIAAGSGSGTFAAAINITNVQPAFGATNPTQWGFLTSGQLGALTANATLIAEDLPSNSLYTFQFSGGVNGGAFSTTTDALPDGPGPVAVVDLNADGNNDVIVLGETGHALQIFLGGLNGLNGFKATPARFKGIPGGPQYNFASFIIKDVNLDGRPDLIAETANGHIDVLYGDGKGSFTAGYANGTGLLNGLTGNGGHLIAVADLNHDGQLDALAGTPAGISTLLGGGTQYFKLGGIYNAGPGKTSYVTADFNKDGNLDLAVDSPEGIAILYGNADGSFQTSRSYAAGAPALSGAVAAFTASGHLDAIVSTAATQAQLLTGAGDGTFAANPAPTTAKTGTPGLWSTLLTADFDADGKLDLLFTADGSNANLPAPGGVAGLYLQRGDGLGNFSDPVPAVAQMQFSYPASSSCAPPFNHFAGQFFGTSAIGDFNLDGIADIANRDDAAYRILRGNNGSASNSYSLAPTLYWSGIDGVGTTVDCHAHAHDLVAAGDLNNDGHADLLYQGSGSNSGALLLYLSSPNGLTEAGDLSVDGSLTSTGQLTAPNIAPNFGGNSTTFNQPYFPGAIATADLDHDGYTDVLVTYANLAADPAAPSPATPNYLYLWFGSGSGKFLTSAKHPVNPVRTTLSRNYYQIATADLNHDGIADLLLSDGLLLSYQLGIGDGSFGPEHHLLAGQGINTIVTSDLRGIGQQDLVLANGGAALANPVANHELLAADPEVNTGGITVLLNTAAPGTLQSSLAVSPEPSVYFSPYDVTATLTGSPTPTGSVLFTVNGTPITATGSNGTFSIIGPLLVPGTYPITATYQGDANYAALTLTPTTHTITRSPTIVTLTPTTPLTVFYGQGIDGIFNLQVVDGAHPANGTYTLRDNGVAVPICTALPVSASCPYGNPVLLDAGQHVFSIDYLGDPVNAPASSPGYTYTILPDDTFISLFLGQNPSYYGVPLVFSAGVSARYATPVGSVTFYDGAQPIATQTLVNGSASITLSNLSLGAHPLSVRYPGNIDFNPSVSATLTEQILPDPVTLQLTSSANPSTLGQPVTFTVIAGSILQLPTGSVTFFDGTQPLATIPLTNGIAAFTTSSLALGTHPISVTYAATSIFAAATSAILNQVVKPIGPTAFTLTIDPTSLVVGVGRIGVAQVTLHSTGGFAQPVALTCANLAPETSCQFYPSATIPAGSTTTTLELFTNAPRDCGTDKPYFLGSIDPAGRAPLAAATTLAGLFLFALRRRRTLRKLLLLTIGTAALLTAGGCGHCTDLGTRPGIYTFTLTGTAQGGPVVQTTTLSIPLRMTIP